jgi:hypothetical protein
MVAIQLEKLTEIRLDIEDVPLVGSLSADWVSSHRPSSALPPPARTRPPSPSKRCRGTPGPQGRESLSISSPGTQLSTSSALVIPSGFPRVPSALPASGNATELPRRSSRLSQSVLHPPVRRIRDNGLRPIRRRLAVNNHVAPQEWYQAPEVDARVDLEPSLVIPFGPPSLPANG